MATYYLFSVTTNSQVARRLGLCIKEIKLENNQEQIIVYEGPATGRFIRDWIKDLVTVGEPVFVQSNGGQIKKAIAMFPNLLNN